jgi:G3E family GTPase
MRNGSDTRIAVVLGGAPGATDAVLVEAGVAAPAGLYISRFSVTVHTAGCLCCQPRSGAGQALAQLFRDRATGSAPFFSRLIVVASQAGEQAVSAAIKTDMLCRARYRLDGATRTTGIMSDAGAGPIRS